ncbi:hypothetical protein WJX73_001841 [Symbiochloris irregularis]|uniref:rRNA processing protein EBP2 n=1 Tax=Symbiochloris irregularis TaxID=706552 RepID=A0AAW1P064_9CHLO
MSSEDDYTSSLSGTESDEDLAAELAAAQLPVGSAQQADVPPQKRPHIYNTAGLLERLEDIAWVADAPWDETQTITGVDPEQVEDVDDDLTRELSFYNQALSASQQAIQKFQAADVPWLRPPDYYAEMVKSDDHMAKVKQQLLYEQNQLQAAEERRKQRDGKKFQKAVHAERIKEKAQSKKRDIENVSRMRRNRARSGYQGDFDVDAALAEDNAFDRQSKPAMRPGDRIRPDDRKVSKKRKAKDEKFGFGGPKRRGKQNDADSAANMDGFRQGRFSETPRGRGGRGGSRGGRGGGRGGRSGGFSRGGGAVRGGRDKRGKPNRPGKARRESMRSG